MSEQETTQAEPQAQESAPEETTNKPVYPGQLARYRELRQERQEAQLNGEASWPMLAMAEEFAGLAYILDGIRYAARQRPQA